MAKFIMQLAIQCSLSLSPPFSLSPGRVQCGVCVVGMGGDELWPIEVS